jgi:hypothetical protein
VTFCDLAIFSKFYVLRELRNIKLITQFGAFLILKYRRRPLHLYRRGNENDQPNPNSREAFVILTMLMFRIVFGFIQSKRQLSELCAPSCRLD